MADTARARKLSERIQQIVARMLDTRIKDPRLGFVTVTDVRVTGDLQHATIFYTVLGTPEERESSAAALASAKGVIRSEVGKQTGIRLTPTIEFVLDAVPETAAGLEEALRAAAARDAELARLAAGATPAGDADPYRRPADEASDADEPTDDAPTDDEPTDDEPTDGDLGGATTATGEEPSAGGDEGDLADER